MARLQFYYHEKGNHDERWYYLCRDERGYAYVETEFSPGLRGGEEIGPRAMSVLEFLAASKSSAQDKLLALIATLVPEGGNA